MSSVSRGLLLALLLLFLDPVAVPIHPVMDAGEASINSFLEVVEPVQQLILFGAFGLAGHGCGSD